MIGRVAILFAADGEAIAPQMKAVAAGIRATDIARLTKPGGSRSTTISGSVERTENIGLAARLRRQNDRCTRVNVLLPCGPGAYDPRKRACDGRDAVVAEWGLDLKVTNRYEHPVPLRLAVDGDTLLATFLGP